MADSRPVPSPAAGAESADAAQSAQPSAQSSRTAAVSPVRFALGFALAAALIPVQPLMFQTFMKLFYEKSPDLIQPPLGEGSPLARAMTWDPRLVHLVENLGSFVPAAVLGLEIALVALLVYGLLRAINPTFRVTTGVDWDHTLLTRTYMHSAPVTKAFLIAVAAFLPAFALWHLLGWALGGGGFSLWLRLALLGAAVWLLFSLDGWAGDFDSGSYEPPRDRAVITSLAVRGALAGAVVWAIFQFAPTMTQDRLFDLYHALGYIGQEAWLRIAALTLGFPALFGLAGGALAVALGAPRWAVARRARVAAVPLALLVLTLLAGRVWVPGYYRAKYDYEPNSHVDAAVQLAARAGLARTPTVPQAALLLDGASAVPVRFSGKSVSGLPAGPDAARAIEAYLRPRGYRTALAYPAYVTLLDAACLDWNPGELLRACLLNLDGAPSQAYVQQFLDKLGRSAPTPDVVRYAGALLHSERFVYPDRQAWVLAGDTFARLGQSDKAQECYRRAELPPGQVTERAAERTQFADGRVSGRILIAGKPAARARVGLLYDRAVGQLHAMTNDRATSPYWLSWLAEGTTTDAQGRFTLDHVQTGLYRLLVSASPPAAPTSPPSVQNGPTIIAVSARSPEAKLGDIAIVR